MNKKMMKFSLLSVSLILTSAGAVRLQFPVCQLLMPRVLYLLLNY